MDFKREAIELYKSGKNIEEIKGKLKIPLEEKLITKWIQESRIQDIRKNAYKLNAKLKKETNYEKKQEILAQLKEKLIILLEIEPDSIELQKMLMFTNISLKDIEGARKIAKSLLNVTDTIDVLNGNAIIEEKSGNFQVAIEYINRILEKEPHNQIFEVKKQRIEQKQKEIENKKQYKKYDNKKKNKKKDFQITYLDIMYRKMATLERSVLHLIEEQKNKMMITKGNLPQRNKLKDMEQRIYQEVYEKVKDLAEEVLKQYPEEVIAHERLIKALYNMGWYNEAKKQAEELLKKNENDEIALWFLCKVERTVGTMEGEKEYLKRLANNPSVDVQIRVQHRLNVLEEKMKERDMKRNKTEEDRQAWISKIESEFLKGTIRASDIKEKIREAKDYPNFTSSFISLINLETMMTEDFERKIQLLEGYIDSKYSLTSKEYSELIREVVDARNKISNKEKMEKIWEEKAQEHQKGVAKDEEETR